ncbi:DUF1488 family protein [Desertibaculum subflavum]|uniref:DUF1488 family protein n=1 Tax=Desertibaculum subflavum TaxID=2268458 RepID=UPI000E666D65
MALTFSTRPAEYSLLARSVLLYAVSGGEGIAFGFEKTALNQLEPRPHRLTPGQQERLAERHRPRLEAAAASAFAEGRGRGSGYCIWIGPKDI